MSDGNGYDARGEDERLERRIDEVADTAKAAHSYASRVEGEGIRANSRFEQTVLRLTHALNDLSLSFQSRWDKHLGKETARAVALDRLNSTLMDLRVDQATTATATMDSAAAVIELRKDFKLGFGALSSKLDEILRFQRGQP